MRFRCVPELLDQRMLVQRSLNDGPLHPLAPSVNQAHFTQSGFMSGTHVLVDDRGNISGMEGVEVE